MNCDGFSTTDSDPELAAAELLRLDELLDVALADSFPASDPPALCSPQGRQSERGASAPPGSTDSDGRDSKESDRTTAVALRHVHSEDVRDFTYPLKKAGLALQS